MKINTQDLLGPALDWAVAKCEGYYPGPRMVGDPKDDMLLQHGQRSSLWLSEYKPDKNWSQGGPIIERERLMLCCNTYGDGKWKAFILRGPNAWTAYGPTPLIAAMRCFVANKLGDKVDVPEELL